MQVIKFKTDVLAKNSRCYILKRALWGILQKTVEFANRAVNLDTQLTLIENA